MRVGKEAKTNMKSERISVRTALYIAVLILFSLFLGSLPAISLGQDLSFPTFAGPVADPKDAVNPADSSGTGAFNPVFFDTPGTDAKPTPDFPIPPPPQSAKPEAPVGSPKPAPAPIASPSKPSPPAPGITESASTAPSDRRSSPVADRAPMSRTQPHPQPAAARSPVARKPLDKSATDQTPYQLRRQPELLKSVAQPDHPFTPYFNPPRDPQSPIQGKPYHVAQLLDNVGNPAQRCILLENYWELAGLLAEYNMYYDAENRVGALYKDAERTNDIQKKSFLQGSYYLLQPQRQAVELSFVKKQYELVERLRSVKGVSFAEDELPIPCDFPVFKQYETYADSLAKTQRSRSVAKLIPIQHKIVEARIVGYGASDRLLQDAMRNPANASDLVESLKQRSRSYSDLVAAVVDYNKMIARYTSETIGPGASSYQLIGALIKLPKQTPETPPENRRTTDIAAPPGNNFSATPIPGIAEPTEISEFEPAQAPGIGSTEAFVHSRYALNAENEPGPGMNPEHPTTFAPQPLPQPERRPRTRTDGVGGGFGAIGLADTGSTSEVPIAANPLRTPSRIDHEATVIPASGSGDSRRPRGHAPVQPVSHVKEKTDEIPPQTPISQDPGSL